MRLSLLVMVSLLAGCAAQPGEAPADEVVESDLEETGVTLRFEADGSTKVVGTLRAGKTVSVVYDEARSPECRGSQGGQPQYSITGYAQLASGEPVSFAVAGVNAKAGTPSFPLPKGEGGDLAVWFQATNRWGCNSYDSNDGQNFHFDVQENAHRPDWVGAASVILSRATCEGGPCDADRQSLDEGFTFGTWARQRAAIRRIDFRVYEPGLTDRDDADLWQKLDAQVHYRHAASGDWKSAYVNLDGRSGNDARYALELSVLDPLQGSFTRQNRGDCPQAPLTVSADGSLVSAAVEFYFTIEGRDLRPAAGGTFRGTFEDYAQSFAVCLP